ncbi:hypothetical protein M5689_003699 [Euphorbia peplus]|nr:hypothetical protein M5689_003699 [Euphorbia peplus]
MEILGVEEEVSVDLKSEYESEILYTTTDIFHVGMYAFYEIAILDQLPLNHGCIYLPTLPSILTISLLLRFGGINFVDILSSLWSSFDVAFFRLRSSSSFVP